jgi:iron complex transport system substrate-binding protein
VVCLTEETTETLYRIGADDLVVGVSGFTVRPPEARRKPRVSSFLSADADRIAALRPDLVVGFSDLQADIARDLVRRGIPVLVTNQRSVAEILQTIRLVAGAVGRGEAGEALCATLGEGLARAASAAAALPRRPRLFLEEWPDPLISGIRWVSELAELCGGEDVCAESRASHAAAGRVFAAAEVARRAPDAVVASWCGRKVQARVIADRPGWAAVPAVRDGQLYEVKSAVLLQPGPAALTDGLAALARVVEAVARRERLPARAPGQREDVARVNVDE